MMQLAEHEILAKGTLKVASGEKNRPTSPSSRDDRLFPVVQRGTGKVETAVQSALTELAPKSAHIALIRTEAAASEKSFYYGEPLASLLGTICERDQLFDS